jgi:hypothetical protein
MEVDVAEPESDAAFHRAGAFRAAHRNARLSAPYATASKVWQRADSARRRVTFSGTKDAFTRYALGLLADYCVVSIVHADDSVHTADTVPDITYGKGPGRICVPVVDHYTAEDVPGVPGRREQSGAAEQGQPFEFDLFAALRFWLADEGNRDAPGAAWDMHERLRAGASAQETKGVREVPIVNAYLKLFRHWLSVRVGIEEQCRLPAGRSAVIVLTHDVDQPLHPADPRNRLWAATQQFRLGSRRSALRHSVSTVARAGALAVLRPRERHWSFPHILNAEERHGFSSTFMFAATSKFDVGGAPFDVDYNVCSPRFRNLFHRLRERGSEIGLHISYGARDDPDRIAQERARLSAAAGVDVISSRHHFWHMKRPFWETLHAHADSGLRCDSSIGFNDAPGYRLGVALAFHPWDPITGRTVEALQIPTLAMDAVFFADPGRTSTSDVVAHLERLLAALKLYEGVAAIDWHEYTSFPLNPRYRNWAATYLELLQMLADDRQIAVLRSRDVLALQSRIPGC